MARNTKIFAIFLKPQMNTRVEVDIPYLVEHFKLTESGIKNKFKRTQENMKNRGYTLEKEGRGDKTKYYIILDEYDSGIDLYDVEKRRLTIPKVVLQQAKDFDFVVFTGIVFTDNAFYLGTRAKFLERIGLAANKKNIQLISHNIFKHIQILQIIILLILTALIVFLSLNMFPNFDLHHLFYDDLYQILLLRKWMFHYINNY